MFCSGKLVYASFYLWRYFYCSATCKEDQEVCAGKSTILSVVWSSFCNDDDCQLLLKTCPYLLFAVLLLWRYSDHEQHFGSTVSFRNHCILVLFSALVTCSHPSDVPNCCKSHFREWCPWSVTTSLPVSSLIHPDYKQLCQHRTGGSTKIEISSWEQDRKGWQILKEYYCQSSNHRLS